MTPDCDRVLDVLGGPLPPDLTSHVAGCAECHALVAGFETVGPLAGGTPAPSPEPPRLEEARRLALAELAARPKPTPWWRELAVLLGVHAVTLGVGMVALSRGHGMVRNASSPSVVAGVALLTLLLVGGGAYVALAPVRRRWPWALVALAAVAVGTAQLLGGSGQQGVGGLEGVLRCLGTEVVVSVLPLGIALVLLCRSAFQPVRALAAGLSASGVALLLLHLHCSDGTAGHLMWGHLLPWLALAGIAAWIRSRLPSSSHAP